MESTKQPFPWPAPITAFLILTAMFIYAGFFQPSPAEESVTQFYKAYTLKDDKTMAEYVSVLWLFDRLPTNESYQTFLAQRPQIETLLTNNPMLLNNFIMPNAEDKIKILRDHTLQGDLVAFVVFDVGESVLNSSYIAILVNEDQLFRLFHVFAADENTLQQMDSNLLNQFEADVNRLLSY